MNGKVSPGKDAGHVVAFLLERFEYVNTFEVAIIMDFQSTQN
jgi:hypothetical protein